MRIETIRSSVWRAGLVGAAAWAGWMWSPTARAQEAKTPADTQTNSHTLVLKGADVAWEDLVDANRPPPSPKEWETTPPTPAQKAKFYGPYARAQADKARDFYTKFPGDRRAPTARLLEFRFAYLTVNEFGQSGERSRLEALEKALLKQSSLPEGDREAMLRDVANLAPEKARPWMEDLAKNAGAEKSRLFAASYLEQTKAIGQPVNIQYTAVDGRTVDLAGLKGKVVLVDFWATWCPPCVGEVPNVKKTYDQFHSKGFEIVGISLDSDKDALTHFVADHKMEWPQFFDGLSWKNKFVQRFGINSIPTMWLIDKKGVLREMNAREDLSGGVGKLLAE